MDAKNRIQKQNTEDGSSKFVLVQPDSGEIQAKATASATAIADAQSTFGTTREQVEQSLRDALVEFDKGQLKKMVLDGLKEEEVESQRYVAWYIYRDYTDISYGVVHYDLLAGTTSPDDAPTYVRNKLRFDTHKMLVSGNKAADRLLGVFKS